MAGLGTKSLWSSQEPGGETVCPKIRDARLKKVQIRVGFLLTPGLPHTGHIKHGEDLPTHPTGSHVEHLTMHRPPHRVNQKVKPLITHSRSKAVAPTMLGPPRIDPTKTGND